MEKLARWLETHQLPCFYKNISGMDCPGCGAQTAFILLLRGNLVESFFAYPPLLLFLALFFFLLLHLIFKFRKGGTYLVYGFAVTACVCVINFIAKLCLQ